MQTIFVPSGTQLDGRGDQGDQAQSICGERQNASNAPFDPTGTVARSDAPATHAGRTRNIIFPDNATERRGWSVCRSSAVCGEQAFRSTGHSFVVPKLKRHCFSGIRLNSGRLGHCCLLGAVGRPHTTSHTPAWISVGSKAIVHSPTGTTAHLDTCTPAHGTGTTRRRAPSMQTRNEEREDSNNKDRHQDGITIEMRGGVHTTY